MNQTKKQEFSSFELTEFNLEGQITIDEFGIIKIIKSEDGRLVLICDDDYGLIDQKNPTPANIGYTDATLGFILDIGIQREKHLTYGSGFYFGTKLMETQSMKKISQANFDQVLFKKIGDCINGYFQSNNSEKEITALKMHHLLTAYNNSRLLFPNFYNDSFLGLMRIIDTLCLAQRAFDFATSVALISPELNREIHKKLSTVEAYRSRIKIAENVFDECLLKAQSGKFNCTAKMASLDQAGKIVFSCFFSAYQYRNKFVHQGLPFPDIVKESLGLENDAGTAYLHPAVGSSLVKIFRPTGFQDGDSIDIHNIVFDSDEAENFKKKYFVLIPTWYFLKQMTRAMIIKEVNTLF